MHSIDATEDGYATGAKDGTVQLWDPEFKPLAKVQLTEAPQGYQGRYRTIDKKIEKIVDIF